MTSDRDTRPCRADELIDALLDGDLAHEESRAAYEALRQNPAACEDLARTRYAIARLSTPVEAPDLTGAILQRVHHRRRFLAPRAARFVTTGRLAAAAAVIGTVALASFVQRHVPEARLAASEPAPVSRVVESSGLTAADRPELVAETVQTIQSSLASPVAKLSLSPAFRPEESMRFGLEVPESAPRAAIYASAEQRLRALGVPAQLMAADAPTASANPFILRFKPLLVILSEPHPPIDEDAVRDDR